MQRPHSRDSVTCYKTSQPELAGETTLRNSRRCSAAGLASPAALAQLDRHATPKAGRRLAAAPFIPRPVLATQLLARRAVRLTHGASGYAEGTRSVTTRLWISYTCGGSPGGAPNSLSAGISRSWTKRSRCACDSQMS
jgi:hypothetical protein